jgi:hypothetical protein
MDSWGLGLGGEPMAWIADVRNGNVAADARTGEVTITHSTGDVYVKLRGTRNFAREVVERMIWWENVTTMDQHRAGMRGNRREERGSIVRVVQSKHRSLSSAIGNLGERFERCRSCSGAHGG